jgi:predicted oxidoreductase
VDFTCGEKRAWLHSLGVRWLPIVQWAERGGYGAIGHGNSVPRFHITWGTGPGVVEPFERRVRAAAEQGLVSLRFRHRVTELTATAGAVDGVAGDVLAPSGVGRGEQSGRDVAGSFALRAQAVIVTSGGIGGNHDMVRKGWPGRYGDPPPEMLSGVPDHVDGRMLEVVVDAGGNLINADRMWNYPEGVRNADPVWTRHGIRILSGPSPLWLDATGRRLPVPLIPGADALGSLEHIVRAGHTHSWFLLNERILASEFALSGSEQNLDFTEKRPREVIRRALPGGVSQVQEFSRRSPDFLRATSVPELAAAMNALVGSSLVDAGALAEEIVARDRQVACGLGKDSQVLAIRAARRFITDRFVRVAKPHALLDPKAGPLVAVRLWILTRKTLGGLQTDLSGRVLRSDGSPLDGVYAAGEVAGFGGGGMHGYRALEGTFLGGCLFSGRAAGRAAAAAVS